MNKAYLKIIIAASMWGVMGIFVRGLGALGFQQIQIGLLRVLVATFMLGIVLLKKDRKLFCIRIKDVWCFIGTGVISLTIYNICYFTALQYVTMSVAAVLLYTSPAFVMLLSVPLFKEKITRSHLCALALVFGGCVMVTGLVGGGAVAVSLPGILYGIGAGVSYALYSIFGRYALNKGYSTYTVTFFTFLFSTVGSIPLAKVNKMVTLITPKAFLFAIGLGVVSCGLPYLLYTMGLSEVENSVAAMLATMEPAVATLTGMIFFHEILSWYNLLGMVMLFLGIIVLAYIPQDRIKPKGKGGLTK